MGQVGFSPGSGGLSLSLSCSLSLSPSLSLTYSHTQQIVTVFLAGTLQWDDVTHEGEERVGVEQTVVLDKQNSYAPICFMLTLNGGYLCWVMSDY
jgi:hypothetical protein